MSRFATFLAQAQQVHRDKYTYGNVNYTNTHTPVSITCPLHGDFLQTPNSHIHKKAGCPECAGKHYLTLERFVSKAQEIHNGVYDYTSITEYAGYDTKMPITCRQHGIFHQSARSHLHQRHGCPLCGVDVATAFNKSRAMDTPQFIQLARTVHGDAYDYSMVNYTNTMEKVTIVCTKHGPFHQTPNNHTSNKHGCPKCGDARSGGFGGMCKQWFASNPDKAKLPAMLYVIHMTCSTDDFIKVGITTKTIKQRYARTGAGQKHITKTILHQKYMSLEDAFALEQHILTSLKPHQYFPNHVLDGRTECLKNIEIVLESIDALLTDK